ncbi:MAG: c-type cytochrome [Woeseiaceae bacterium]|nr:c-type cytochrome [Woeseiaceae bacterium]
MTSLKVATAALFIGFTAFSTAARANDTFESVCSSCHTGGIRGFISGAPNISRPKAWRAHLAEHSEEEMLSIVLNGTKDHKVRGGCRSCSDQEILDALRYLLSEVEQP